jgi:DNA-directed RNA polymerase subunit RPC12/RpoP
MSRAGLRKYVCVDCGAFRFVRSSSQSSRTRTGKNHCTECGSTFLEPYSRGAQKTYRETRQNVDELSKLVRAPANKPSRGIVT